MIPRAPDAGQTPARSRINWFTVAYHFCRILIGLLFIVASYDKILMPWNFGRAIYVYKMLPGYLISPMAASMPWVELVAGILLVFNRFTRPAAMIIGGLNIVFMVAIATVIARGMDIDCGCGLDVGPLALIVGTQADGWALVRDLILLGIAAIIYFGYKPRRG